MAAVKPIPDSYARVSGAQPSTPARLGRAAEAQGE
jgi:hypothetical protein